MKKSFLSMLLVLASLMTVSASAEGILDNSLKFNSGRIERGEDVNRSVQSELTRSLFSESDQAVLDKIEKEKQEQFASNQGQLFSASQTKADVYSVNQLFLTNQENTNAQGRVEEEEQEAPVFSSMLPTISYLSAILVMIAIATFLTYHVSKKGVEEGETTH